MRRCGPAIRPKGVSKPVRTTGRSTPAVRTGIFLGAALALCCARPEPPPAERPAPAAPEAIALAAVDPAEEPAEGADPLPASLPVPPAVRISLEHEEAIDRAAQATIERGGAPGCVIVLGRSDGVVFRRAYGDRAIDPAREPMSADTIFDLASLTKAVATTSAILWLVEHDRVALDAPAARYLPELAGGGRERITVRHLLTHRAGLPPVDPLSGYEGEREAVLARILRTRLESAPGAQVRYSDLGFVILGALVERVSGRGLDAFVRETIFEPLGMRETRFSPPEAVRARVAPTERAERRGGELIRGVVHDPRAWRLGGVAGHAGLFSSADDLSRFARALLGGGELDGARVFSRESVGAMRTRDGGLDRALGWDMGHATLSRAAFGHGGFTGTSLWIDPERDLFVLLLSNRVHPDGRGDVQPLVRELGRIASEAVPAALPRPDRQVLAGVDVLRRDGFRALDGARVALLTHDAARARDGARTLDLIAAAPNVRLVSILSPEHGLSGRHEGRVADGARGGVPVHSLFGPTRAPTDAMLEGADTLVVDLADVGVRFYTYASTMRRAMEAAAARGLRVVILDRPDPLGGAAPRGPVCETSLASFVNHHTLPAVHAMTIGELALLLDAEREIGARPVIVPLEGWRRGMRFGETGLRWVPPSPNLRTPEEALLYPALGLLEGTNVSVGRGTDAPFEQIGAPWMDPEAVIAQLGAIDGVRIEPVRFVPRAARHRRVPCLGLRLTVEDPERFDAVRTGLAIARALRHVHEGDWDAESMLPMIGSRQVHRALLEGADVDTLERLAAPGLREFAERRRRHLRYE